MQSTAWEMLIGGLFAAVFLIVACAPLAARWRREKKAAPAPLAALPTSLRAAYGRRLTQRSQRPPRRVSTSLRRREADSNR